MTSRHGLSQYAPFTLVSETHKREKDTHETALRISKPNLVCGWYITRMYLLGSFFDEISEGVLESRMVRN